jgi:N-acetylglucosamine-6-phosphate deacetylase
MHIHGANGWDFSFGDVNKINGILDHLLIHGITGIIPTLITCSEKQRLQALKDIAKVFRERTKPPIIHGIYLEGPFLSANKRGSHPQTELLKPDFELFMHWQKACDNMIKIITIAPELDGATEFIKRATAQGVICAIGHSEATWQQTEEAVAAGATHVTHLFNAMPQLHHRDPNVLSFILSNSSLHIEVIADGFHISPEMIKLAYSIFDNESIILISDCIATAGLPDGKHKYYRQELTKQGGKCTSSEGKLFGGSFLLSEAIKKLGREFGIPWGFLGTSVWRNPCSLLKIAPPSTEVLFDPDFNWLATRLEDNWYYRSDD